MPDRPTQHHSSHPRRIVLTGFMAAGKSTIGRLLAQRLDWPFFDADTEIENRAGATVAEIFASHGEPYFRQVEHETIRSLLAIEPAVLALGGGAIEDPRTLGLLFEEKGVCVIYLEASLSTILARAQAAGAADPIRPLLADNLSLESRYLRRLPLYQKSSHTIGVDAMSPEAIVESILSKLTSESNQ